MNDTGYALSAGAVARILGVSPATLRTWARRYGLEPSARSVGAHRRYSAEDLGRLQDMQRLMRSGVSVADAAALVQSGHDSEVADEAVTAAAVRPSPARCRSLWEAALVLDAARCSSLVAETVSECGVVEAWEHLVRPVLTRAGEKWEDQGRGVEVEHVLSDSVAAGLVPQTPVASSGVLLSATAGEEHVLPLHALRAALAEAGIGSVALTARTPREALHSAVGRTRPAVVILWAQLPENADVEAFRGMPSIRPGPRLGAAGPGWSDPLPSGVTHLCGLPDALSFVRASIV